MLSALRANDLAATNFASLGIVGDKNIGDVDLYGIHAQANKVMSSNFDIFLSLGLNKTHPNGNSLFMDMNQNRAQDPTEPSRDLLNNDGTPATPAGRSTPA